MNAKNLISRIKALHIGNKGESFGIVGYVGIAIAIVVVANLLPTIWNAVSTPSGNTTPYSTAMNAMLPLTGLLVAVVVLLIPVYKGLKG